MADVKSYAIRFNVTPAMHAAVQQIADDNDVSVAHVVRAALRKYLLDKEPHHDRPLPPR